MMSYKPGDTSQCGVYSPCCGAVIERVYYRFDSMRSCKPDEADWAERVCGECGKEVAKEEGDGEK